MKRNALYVVLFVSIVIVCMGGILVIDFLYGTGFIWDPGPYEGSSEFQQVKSLIMIGDEREEVLNVLAEENWHWHHVEIIQRDGEILDLYLFGPKQPDKVKAILITSISATGHHVIDSIHDLDTEFIGEYSEHIPYLEMVENNVSPGDDHEDIPHFKSTWKQKTCNQTEDSIDDLLIFGNDFYGLTIVHFHSISINGDMIIEYIEEVESLENFSFCRTRN